MTAPTPLRTIPTGALVATERKLRPARLADVVGQDEAIEKIQRAIDGARERGGMPAPILLMGPPGTGKTTIANAIAHELGGRLVELFGVSLRYPRDVTTPLGMALPRDVIIVDEIHRVSRPVQEILYTVMEDGRMSTGDRILNDMITLPPLTIIGATTDPERLTDPMLDRFRLKVTLAPYTTAGLVLVAQRAAVALGVGITDEAARMIAVSGQGTPRVVINIVWAARDWAQPITDDPSPAAKWFGTTPADAPINLSVHTLPLPSLADYRGAWRDDAADRRTDAEYLDLAEHAVAGTKWITTASVCELIESPALVWRVDGRDAG
jgi:Holliday junction resolvasome RuvABC ATP-dependent DNA helicase subunit